MENKKLLNVLVKLLYGFGITLLVSSLAGLFFMSIGLLFWPVFFFFFVAQLVGFYFYGEHVKRKNAYLQAQLELAAASELAKITADVVCPCDKKVRTTIPIEMNSENTYICAQCEKKIGVSLKTETFLKTDPLKENPLEDPFVAEYIQKALKDPKHNDRI